MVRITLEDVDPALRAAARRIDALPSPPAWVVPLALRLVPAPRFPDLVIRTLRVGVSSVRVYRPKRSSGRSALLWIHGGGLVLGDARQDEALCGATARRLGIAVVSANYRLAPRHPYPAALDDVHAAWAWLQQHARRLGVDPGRVAVGGESAGGGLAAALVQRLHDEGARPPAQWLFAPMLDDRTAADRSLDALGHLVWDNAKNRHGWSSYLGHEPGGAEVRPWSVPARRPDLAGLPPAFITWGDVELFAAEDAAYAERLRGAGVPVAVDVVPGAPHGFENWAGETPPARALIDRAQRWLAERLDVPLADG